MIASLEQAGMVSALIASVGSLIGIVRSAFLLGKIYQKFEQMQMDFKVVKEEHSASTKQVTRLIARCKMCLEEE